MRWLLVVGVVVVAVLSGSAVGSGSVATSAAACTSGSVAAVIGGKRVCLKAGLPCKRALDARYHRYGLHCHATGRLTKSAPAVQINPKITVSGPEKVVFDWSTDRCDDTDIPDLPARAYRDAEGNVVLFASHMVSRRMIGSDLDHLRRDCSVAMDSRHDPDPAAFDDNSWLSGMYTADGTTIYALVHDEYHGYEHPGQCPVGWPGAFLQCWYNALTLAVSTDEGRSFTHATPPAHLVASVPYRYTGTNGLVGITGDGGSDIVRNPTDGYLYATIRQFVDPAVTGVTPVWSGTCIMRTNNLADPGSWRAWGGKGFTVAFANPYGAPIVNPASHLCKPIFANDPYGLMGESLSWNTQLRRFLLVGSSPNGFGGVYAATSSDLTHWTEPTKVIDATFPWTYACGGPSPVQYMSVIDPASTTRNLDTTGSTAYLYYTRHNYTDCHMTLDRDLVRVPITIS